MCKMGARSPHSDNALILQGQRNSIDWGTAIDVTICHWDKGNGVS
jgi:hypothetical protein